jgi:hypothetical protein
LLEHEELIGREITDVLEKAKSAGAAGAEPQVIDLRGTEQTAPSA